MVLVFVYNIQQLETITAIQTNSISVDGVLRWLPSDSEIKGGKTEWLQWAVLNITFRSNLSFSDMLLQSFFLTE